tara:strand:+ start:456 stop:1475 length:1020 start_codon:yes stop_codon:yes gene_type:complete
MDNYTLLIYKILVSLILIGLLNGLRDKISSFVGAHDNPGYRKIHKFSVPLIGGVLIYSYLIVYCLSYFFIFKDNLLLEFNIFSINNLIFLNLIIFLVFFIGIIDDKFQLTNIKKLFLLSIMVFLICYQDRTLIPTNFEFSFDWNIIINNLNKIIIFIIIISFIISMNLFDGVNLQSGIFYLINFFFLSIYSNNINIIFIFCFPVFFFLYLNYKNKCFLGDSGSNLLSFILIYLLIKSSLHSVSTIYFDHIILFIFLPCLDSLRLFIYRIWVFGDPFKADMDHFHHILLRKHKFNYFIMISSSMILLPHILFIIGINFFISILVITFLYCFLLFNSYQAN